MNGNDTETSPAIYSLKRSRGLNKVYSLMVDQIMRDESVCHPRSVQNVSLLGWEISTTTKMTLCLKIKNVKNTSSLGR